ncbi:MAG: dihydroneopterin aldolase [Lentisphaeria bacterium]|nr:dihydroneopterin aldolase [Lentisphaeria bacterium]
MSTVNISNLSVNALIGTLEHEKIYRQQLLLDVEFDYDSTTAALTDDLFASVDYSAVERAVVRCVGESRFALLEALAGAIGRSVLAFDRVQRCKVIIRKPAASAFGALISYTAEFFPEK